MMKKTYKSSLLALSVLASFTSCSESESLQQANLSKDKITFHATLDNTWKPMSPASSSRAAIAAATEKGPIVVPTPFGKPLYLHPVVQDGIHIWSKEGKPITRSGAPLEDVEHERVAQTRGTMSTKTDLSDYNSFGVTAIYKEGDTYQSLFANAEATKSAVDGFWGIEDKDKAQWPIEGVVSFHAYAPFYTKSSNMLTVTAEPEKVQSKITYTASTDNIINQPDLIVATSTGSRNNPGQDEAVNLQFSHALTAVSFAISKDLVEVIGAGNQLVSISLEGVYTQGDCELAAKDAEHSAALLKWTGTSDKTGKYEFDLKDKNIVINENLKDMALTEDNQTLMMIPQTLTAEAKLKFEFKLNGVLQSVIIDMQGHEWLPGTSVIYKLSSSAINSLSNAEVVYPTTWNEVGYPKKAFAENEAIGLYAVSKDNKIVASNVKLVKQKNEKGEEIWKTTENKRFLYTANYRYFAYYPYDSTLKDEDMNAEAADADGFFAKKITAWVPVANQNTEDILLNQELQVASGVVEADASTLTFEMAHQMGLAVLTLSDKKIPVTCYFKDNSYMYYYGDKTIEPKISKTEGEQTLTASTDFEGNVPYCVTKGTKYLQIIPLGVQTSFKAGNPNDDTRTHWGFLKSHSLTPTESTPQQLSIQADPAFIYGVRDFEYDTRYNPVTGAGVGQELEFVQEFGVPEDATYKLECWGASSAKQTAWYGHGYPDEGGGYSKGNAKLKEKNTLYVCVGGEGTPNVTNQPGYGKRYGGFGGYNGGTNPRNGNNNTYSLGGSGGGGATHIGFKKALLTAFREDYDTQLIMVAGGRGGDSYHNTGGCGGGDAGGVCKSTAQAATVITNYDGSGNFYDPKGQVPWWYSFGCGSIGRIATGRENGSGGGGGGFWGGWVANNCPSAGGGGTGYINKAFLDSEAKTIAGNVLFDSPNGVQEKGHKGHGAAKISWEAKKCFNP